MFSEYVIDTYELAWYPPGRGTGCSHGFYIGTPLGLKGEPKILVEKNEQFLPISISTPIFPEDNTIPQWIEKNRQYLLKYWNGDIEFWDLIDVLEEIQ